MQAQALALDADQALGGAWAQHGTKDNVADLIKSHDASFRTGRPFIKSSDHLLQLIEEGLETTMRTDFCWSLNFTPLFLAHLVREGFLPICSDLSGSDGLWVLLPKWHKTVSFQWKNPDFLLKNPDFLLKNVEFIIKQRCCMKFSELVSKHDIFCIQTEESCIKNEEFCIKMMNLQHVSKSARKKAKKYRLTADAAFDEVIDRCVEQHGENWLYPPMRAAFRALHHWGKARDAAAAVDGAGAGAGVEMVGGGAAAGGGGGAEAGGTRPPLPAGFPALADEVRFHSFEVWSADGSLAAGEFGAVVGGVYTSFTGFFDHAFPGAGTVQLCGMARLLQDAGFAFWDLGQEIPYKVGLGASLLPRAEFLAEFRAARDTTTMVGVGTPLHTLPRATAPAVLL